MKRTGRLERLIVLGMAALGGLAGVYADTLTWSGGPTKEGDFTAAASWSPAQKPQPGDTLVIQEDVTFKGATFDVGTAGLTIQRTKGTVRCNVSFSGSGDLVITGSGGTFYQDGACPSLTGDWRLRGGVFEPCPGGMGSGKVYVEDSSRLQIGDVTLTNDVCVVGTDATIAFARAARLMGVLSANADLVLDVVWVDANRRVEIADLRAGTSTVTIRGNAGHTLDFTGTVEAQLVKKEGACEVRFTGTSDAAETTLSVEGGTVSFTGSARWSGPSVTATGEGTVLRFDGANLTADGVTVRVADGARLDVASLTILPSLTLGDQALEPGTYQAGNLPDNVTGAGILLVGGEVTTWIGGAAGAWSEGSNWSTGTAPKGMVVARFTNEVELAAEPFDFGADGVCIWNSANLIQGTAFAGTGRYRKFGSGRIEYRANSSYTGGTLLTDGSAYLGNEPSVSPQAFGAAEGVVELTRNLDGTGPFFEFGAYNVPIANKIRLVGEMKAARIWITNPVNLKGDVESDADFLIYSGWGWLHADGAFRAPGKTITFQEDDKKLAPSYFAGAVDAALVKKGTASLELRGRSSGATNVLTAAGGRLRLTAEAAWEGPVVVKKGGLLVLDGRDNLSSSAATLTVEEGGKVEIAEGVGVRVKTLVLNGQKMPVGVYSAANQPTFLGGAGHVVVGKATVIILR